MSKRFKMSRGKSNRVFAKTAASVNPRNMLSPMRGGFRF